MRHLAQEFKAAFNGRGGGDLDKQRGAYGSAYGYTSRAYAPYQAFAKINAQGFWRGSVRPRCFRSMTRGSQPASADGAPNLSYVGQKLNIPGHAYDKV